MSQDFLDFLYRESCVTDKSGMNVQLNWLEQRVFQIRKHAVESDAGLVVSGGTKGSFVDR